MVRCEYCNAPMLSTTTVCPNCHREQPPYPPVLPGGGGRSYSGWALILSVIATLLMGVGIATFFQAPYSTVSAYTYGSPGSYINGNNPQYLSVLGTPITPGIGYLIFFGGFAIILYFWAFVSYNRGRRIDRINAPLVRSLRNVDNRSNQRF